MKITYYDEMVLLEAKMSEFRKLKPEDLGINKKFCLNNLTLNFQKKLVEESETKTKKNKFENIKISENEKDDFNEVLLFNEREDQIKLKTKLENKIIDMQQNSSIGNSYSVNNLVSPSSNGKIKFIFSYDEIKH